MKMPLFLSFLLLAGCGTAPRESLQVGIAGITIADTVVKDDEAVITLRITNETLFPLVVESDQHKIYLNGRFIGEGRSAASYALPQRGTVEVDITLKVANAAALEVLRSVDDGTRADYRIESRLNTNSFGQKAIVKNDNTGSVSLAAQ